MRRISLRSRVPFYAQLPKKIAKEIRRRSRATGLPQWQIIGEAINRTAGERVTLP